jgi:hypothetical protein
MPTFRPKHIKKITIPQNQQFTLDKKHSEFIEEFHNNEESIIPKLKLDIHKLTIQSQKHSSLRFHERYDIQDKINSLEKEIERLEQQKMDYYLDNSKYIFDYFENKKKIGTMEEDAKKNLKSLNSFFFCNSNEQEKDQKNSLLNNYLKNIDGSSIDQNLFVLKKNICKHCLKGEMISMEDEGVLLCNMCSVISKYLIENEKPSYRETPKEVSFYAYKKINHFKEILCQFQGKESTSIPIEVFETIKAQIKKERIQVLDITYDELKALLKKLGYNKYYEHINFIKHKLGIPPLMIAPEVEEILCNFFLEIQYPYAKHCPDYRINFLHYYYVLYKLFQLIGEDKYLKEIPMLKDKDKLIEQDEIWKQICRELNWEFIPTV